MHYAKTRRSKKLFLSLGFKVQFLSGLTCLQWHFIEDFVIEADAKISSWLNLKAFAGKMFQHDPNKLGIYIEMYICHQRSEFQSPLEKGSVVFGFCSAVNIWYFLVFSNVFVFHVWIMFLCGFTLVLIDILGESSSNRYMFIVIAVYRCLTYRQ
jgi:hypothetical protein